MGSPPHTREKGRLDGVELKELGITPAYAGKSDKIAQLVIQEQDHPRIRGKKCPYGAITIKTLGSPPHTREKVMMDVMKIPMGGITPAYAGKRDVC